MVLPQWELLTTAKGNIQILYEGFSYHKKYSRKSTIRFECSMRKRRKCPGALITDKEVRTVNYYVIVVQVFGVSRRVYVGFMGVQFVQIEFHGGAGCAVN